jgi:cytoskeletal protein CcmA (bactofilin family)
MFKPNKQHGNEGKGGEASAPASINLIGSGTFIEGDIRSNGDIRVDGTVIGNVQSKSKVVVGSTGTVEGDVNCQNMDVSGTVKGKLTVSELTFLKSSATIKGDILTGKLVVEVGATFSGSCNMGAVIKDINDVDNGLAKERSAL